MADPNNNNNHNNHHHHHQLSDHHHHNNINNSRIVGTDYDLDPADGKQYVLELRDKLIELLNTCHTIEDVESRLRILYPDSKVIDGALKVANKSRKLPKVRNHSSSSSASVFTGAIHIAVAKVSSLVRDGVIGGKSGESEVTKFKLALIESIIDDVIRLADNFVSNKGGSYLISRSDIRLAMHADKDLLDLFLSDDKCLFITQNHPIMAILEKYNTINNHNSNYNFKNNTSDSSLSITSYKQRVRNMVDSEIFFIRGLKLITKVFKPMFSNLPHISHEVDIIFCNIDELLELATLVLAALEEALESVEPEAADEVPFVGMEILDLAQAEEFQVYANFAHRRMSYKWKQAYVTIISDELTMSTLKKADQSFDQAVRYLLPNYLLNTIIQFYEYFKNICDLHEISKRNNNREDELALRETISILIKTKKSIEKLLEEEIKKNNQEDQLDPKQLETIRASLEKRLDSELENEKNQPLYYMPPPDMYRFSEPDSKDNIQFEERGSDVPVIKYATLIKLVERLTYHKYQPTIVDCFLTTYRSFITDPEELLDLLIERFKIPDPPISIVLPNYSDSSNDLPECDRNTYKQYLKRFRQEYSKPVKMRVINVLKSWIKNHYYDYERNPALLHKLTIFLDEVYQSDKVLRSLINSLRKSIEQKKISQRDEIEFMLSKEPPPILWLPGGATEYEHEKFDLLTLHPKEFARQLTLIQFDLFRAIKPSELINVRDLGMKTKKDDGYESSPNLSRMTRHFTLFSYWIRKCIVETDNLSLRCEIYKRVLEIMGYLRKELNNFTGLLSIGSAIESAPIVRLARTNKNLNSNSKEILDEYRDLTDNHQKKLQAALKSCNPPCIPYLGSYQTKLIHAKEGNRTFIDDLDTSTISPTLSNDEFHSSFSNSPATPITSSPRNNSNSQMPCRTPNMPLSAASTLPNQFTFAGFHQSSGSFQPGSFSPHSSSTLPYYPQHQQAQPPTTPASPKLLINFSKQLMRAKLVGEISNYQNQPYCLTVQPEIRRFIESIEYEMTKFAIGLASSNGESSSMESSVPALTKRLDDYLFERSERIEPKVSMKPPKSKETLWKSPGSATIARTYR